jgi:hypothetical protein
MLTACRHDHRHARLPRRRSRLTIPDLNTRETAIALWTAATLVLALAVPDLRAILAEGFRIAGQPLARVLLACTTLIALAATGLLALVGYWHTSMLPPTITWFIGTAIVGTFSMEGVGELRTLILRAAEALGVRPEEVKELLIRADGLSAIGRVEQAQAARILAERGRSLGEIELILPEVGRLATLHAIEIIPVAAEFDTLLSLGDLSADDAPRLAAEVHALAAPSGLTIPDTIGAFVTLLGGAQAPEPQTADP